MRHYFTDNADMSHNRRVVPFRFLDIVYQFNSDQGVFSREDVDRGTIALLKNIDFSELGNRIVDLGCGYGVIAIIIQKITNAEVLAIDINQRAVTLTIENNILNKTKVEVKQNDGLDGLKGPFTAIITNPPIRAGKNTVYRFFEQAYDCLVQNGQLWVVIRKQQGAQSAINKINTLFGNCRVVAKDKGYWILLAIRP
ncbi:MAG: methyltransferase [Erysipelotrichaceae bacterium]|nr:methyltransferase [Erysipelotrichaceae bacterium]